MEAWRAERATYLGGTDIAAILGVNPYKTPLGVFLEKRGETPPQESTAAMKRGLRLEPYIAQLYTERTGLSLFKAEMIRHPVKAYLAVNPDYELPGSDLDGDGRDDGHYVECKSHLPWVARHYGEPGSDEVPAWEVIQATWQMHLGTHSLCDVAVLLGLADEDFRIYTVVYDTELGAMLEDSADRFWHDHVLAGEPPAITGSDADAELLKILYPHGREASVMATLEIEDACAKLRDARRARKALEAEETACENVIKAFMRDASLLETLLGPFQWKAPRGSPAWKRIAEELNPSPALIAKHTPEFGARRFLTPFKGE